MARSRVSAGLLLYRLGPGGGLEVLIAFPGGPIFARRDEGYWTVPKGEYEPEEEPLSAACREFAEELGSAPPEGERIDLGSITQKGGKVVRAWALEGDLDTSTVVSNEFEMEWPPRSGTRARFPEIARAEWFAPEEARRKLKAAQVPFLDRLEAALRSAGRL
ncbi:MAG: NUDIX domain-containing protein [Acidimicrobiales bacterium]